MDNVHYSIRVCSFDGCINPSNLQLRGILREEIRKHQLENKAQIIGMGCSGHCAPWIIVEELGGSRFSYSDLTEEKVKKIFNQHIIDNRPVQEWAVYLD